MENTIQNKAKFLSLHVTQRLDDRYFNAIIRGVVQVGISSKNWIVKTQHLKIQVKEVCLPLKPLSSITDVDAAYLADISGTTIGSIWQGNSFANLGDFKSFISEIHHLKEVSGFFDFLRSRGYAVSWMGLSVDQLIEYGWIKLKEVSNG